MKKLRNKKTNDIIDLNEWTIQSGYLYITISNDNDSTLFYKYESLAELNKEWEDYMPKEPLIKDEKIRKAVRAWAEALGLQEVYCASNGYEIYGGIDDWVIQFEGEPFPFADKNKIYTITELCGEEEK